MFKLIKSLLPWYLRPSHLMDIVPELIKDSSNKPAPEKEHKIGLEEIAYGVGVLVVMSAIRFYI